MRLDVEEKGLKLSITEGRKEGNSKVMTPLSYNLRGDGGRGFAKQLKAKEKARWKTCDVGFAWPGEL